MPDDPPIEPCPACEAKIILNGGVAARVLGETCHMIYGFVESGQTFPDGHKLVEMANKLEDDAFAFTREALEQIGFSGPWPRSMRRGGD